MHVYNAWLPPPVIEQTKLEKEAFAKVVTIVREIWRPDDPETVYTTLKWLSVIELFLTAKSDIAMEDVSILIEFGLIVFHHSQDKLHAQVRWGNTVIKFINKYWKELVLKLQWKPLYNCLINTHFRRNLRPEGWKLRQKHFGTLTALVKSCRRFFPHSSAMEMWSDFRPFIENPWYNSAFLGCGLVNLFLPTNLDNHDFFLIDWIETCMHLWDSIPNCTFWSCQWASVIARVIKDTRLIDWEFIIPSLFTKYLNMLEVPVSNDAGSPPFPVDVPRSTRFLFPVKKTANAKLVAKSIVYLLKPGSSAQIHFEKFVNLIEHYYHPSNGGRWTSSLERFLHHLVREFEQRLKEQLTLNGGRHSRALLGKIERTQFVQTVLKLIDRGQYSKDECLSDTVARALSILSYLEPSLVLPFVCSRFHMALETMTATHQLKAAITSVAYSGRSFLLMSTLAISRDASDQESRDGANCFGSLLMVSLSNALLGIDANDPPKTIATMQLISSVISNMDVLADDVNGSSLIPGINFSEWLDEFLCRLFSLLIHLEPHRAVGDDTHLSEVSGTFLVEKGSYYLSMLQILFARLSEPLQGQALKKISKFVKENILSGTSIEVGLLCCACVVAYPNTAVAELVKSITYSIISSFEEAPSTGFDGKGILEKHSLSPALEIALEYRLKVLSVSISYGGAALLQCRDHLKEVIFSAFESASWKVNGAGRHVLRALLRGLICYYPIDQYRCVRHHAGTLTLDSWISTKDDVTNQSNIECTWHVPNDAEIAFANELIQLHLNLALDDLLRICQTELHRDTETEKVYMKIILLRISSTLDGIMSCLPNFLPSSVEEGNQEPCHFFISGSSGATVGSTKLREKAADVIHVACKYVQEKQSDDSMLLSLIIRVMNTLGNYGSLEYHEWLDCLEYWKQESSYVVEPPINFIDDFHSKGKRRPRWSVIDRIQIHNMWRSSQAAYHQYKTYRITRPPCHVNFLTDDLLDFSLHRYETVQTGARKTLLVMVKHWPALILKCVLFLTPKLDDPNVPEHEVIGACAILSSNTVLKYLTLDAKAFSSFLLAILSSSHHDSPNAQKSINELFSRYSVHFSGVSRRIFRISENEKDTPDFSEFVFRILSLSHESPGLHWRYNLMANRILLLLAMVATHDQCISSKILGIIAVHFLKNLNALLPQMRLLSVTAQNILLAEGGEASALGEALVPIIQEPGFLRRTLDSLSYLHMISGEEGPSSGDRRRDESLQSAAITQFYFDFLGSWPRTPTWISVSPPANFYPSFARMFERLARECGSSFTASLKDAVCEFAGAEERSKQCVAAEALAGVMHSDAATVTEEFDGWMADRLRGALLVSDVPEWEACVRYAATGKGMAGSEVPVARQRLLNCIAKPLPETAPTSAVSRRHLFLASALLEVFPPRMASDEVKLHTELVEELLANMKHSSAQVRETVGVTLCVLCTNLRLHPSSRLRDDAVDGESWDTFLVRESQQAVSRVRGKEGDGDAGDDDIKWIETVFHFVISSLKSGRCSCMLDVVVGLLSPVISLQETTNKDLSLVAKVTLELLKWRVFNRPHLEQAILSLLGLLGDSNWRLRNVTLAYLQTFMYRHTFLLSPAERENIWVAVEKLLVDSRVEVRERASAVLAGLLKGGDEDLVRALRDRVYAAANHVFRTRTSTASVHGVVLSLASSVLSVPYDMPSWLPEHVTLLARFIVEPPPIKSTVRKAVAEFRRTHADTWSFHKDLFTQDQLDALADTASSSSYFV